MKTPTLPPLPIPPQQPEDEICTTCEPPQNDDITWDDAD